MNELTLEQAKKILRESIEKDGATCPCCNQFVKAYKRKITSSMAYSLIRIVKHLKYESDVEFHLQDLAIELGLNGRDISDFAKLRFWGMIRQLDGKREDGSSRNGYYTITFIGIKFIHGLVEVPKYIFVYDNSPYKRSKDELISIKDALGSKFNYNELMS